MSALRILFCAAVCTLLTVEIHAEEKLLFSASPDVGLRELPANTKAKRTRRCAADMALLDPKSPRAGLALNLFDNAKFDAIISAWKTYPNDQLIINGRIAGHPDSSLLIVAQNDALTGLIVVPGVGVFELKYLGDNQLEIFESNPARETETCGTRFILPKPIRNLNVAGIGNPLAQPRAGPVQVDILVVYTTQARIAAGGANGIAAAVAAHVQDINDSFARSQVEGFVTLVGTSEVSYSESNSISKAIDDLHGGNGVFGAVHAQRDTLGADVVGLLYAKPDNALNGIAFVNTNSSDNAYFVANLETGVRLHTFAHEFAHICGCAHDRNDGGNQPQPGDFSYANGHDFTAGGTPYKTILSRLATHNQGQRIGYFSNPNVSFQGTPTGVAEGGLINGAPASADNARALNQNLSIIAAFRQSQGSANIPPAVSLTTPANNAQFVSTDTITATATASDADGTIAKVDFFIDTTLIGTMTAAPYSISISNLTAVAGTHTLFAAATDNGGARSVSTSITITVQAVTRPVNDDFAKRIVLTGLPVTAKGTNVDATKQTGESAIGDGSATSAGKSVWWSWVAPASGRYTVSTYGSEIDTTLSVFTGSSLAALVEVASNNNDPLLSQTNSRVVFTATQGTSYRIAVDSEGSPGKQGTIALRIAPGAESAPDNNDFANRIPLTETAGTVNGTNLYANSQTGEPQHADSGNGNTVWWSWTAPATGVATLSTKGSFIDTVLGVYTGTAVNALTAIASNDDASYPDYSSLVKFNAVAGTTYKLAVDSFDALGGVGSTGPIALTVNLAPGVLPENNTFAASTPLEGFVASKLSDSTGATKETGEPDHAAAPGGKSVWFNWQAPASGPVTISVSSDAFDTLLGVYTGTSVCALTPVASNDNVNAAPFNTTFASTVTFNAVAATVYQIAVDGAANTNGQYRIDLRLNVPPPNDNFAAAISITGAKVLGLNIGATLETSEPSHGVSKGGKSVWWTWTAPATGSFMVSTDGSTFDTSIDVYTGATLATLQQIATNEDANGSTFSSRASFSATAGSTYYIAIDGYRFEGGEIDAGGVTLTIFSSPQLSIAANPAATIEAGTPAQFALTRTGTLDNFCTAVLSLSGSGALGLDFKKIALTATFAPGQTTVAIPLTAIDDLELQSLRTATLAILPNGAYTRGIASASITIADNESLALTSEPIASPNPAAINQTVLFTVGTNFPVALTVDYGDGISNKLASHKYPLAGLYNTTLTATHASGISIAAPLLVTVLPDKILELDDSDGDGFPDDVELALNTDSKKSTSTPMNNKSSTKPDGIKVTKTTASLNFKRPAQDKIQVRGTIDVDPDFSLDGVNVSVFCAGASSKFVLNRSGRGRSSAGTFALSARRGSVMISLKGNFAAAFAKYGMAETSQPVKLPLFIIFPTRTQTFQQLDARIYTRKKTTGQSK